MIFNNCDLIEKRDKTDKKYAYSNPGFEDLTDEERKEIRRISQVPFDSTTYLTQVCIPSEHKHWPNVRSMLGHRRRRLVNIEPALGQCLVFAGYQV